MIKISLVIPTYNNKKTLRTTLVALNDQSCRADEFEVIVVDDGSTDDTTKGLVKLAPRLNYKTQILRQEKRGPAAARNKGIRNAKGEMILVINDDTTPTPDLVRKHLDFHTKHPEENFGLLGFITWHPKLKVTPFMYWLEHGGPYFSFSEICGKEAGWERFWTCNISLKRKFLLKNGLFDEEFPYAAWEDVELGYRLGKAGLRLFYDQGAIGFHNHPTTVDSIKNKMLANGESALLLKEKIPKNYLTPLAKTPITQIAVILDTLFSPVFFFLEQLAKWSQRRFNLSLIFDLVLLHYRILGLKRGFKTAGIMKRYDSLLAEEMEEWKKIEKEMEIRGIPWWVDLRRARVLGKNLFWRDDPKKEALVRGEEKKRMIEMAKRKGGRVLDLGCGSGWLSLELARNGLEVVGVDASPDRIRIAEKFFKDNPYKENFGKLKYVQGDINKVTFPEKYFDTIVVWDTLHHFPNLDQILVKFSRFLKQGGQFIVFDHIGNRYLKLADRIYRFFSTRRKEEKIVAYEDLLGKEMLEIIGRYFKVEFLETKLCFPISALLYLFFSRDLFFSFLTTIVKVDNLLCRSKIFTGEYFFLKGIKK